MPTPAMTLREARRLWPRTWGRHVLTEDEREMVKHVSMWGQMCLVKKVGSRHWGYDFRTVESPVLFKTKREALESLGRRMEMLLDALGYESQTRFVKEHPEEAEAMVAAELAKRGWERMEAPANVTERLTWDAANEAAERDLAAVK